MFTANDLVNRAGNVNNIRQLFMTNIVMISYSNATRNTGQVHAMGVVPGWVPGPGLAINCTGFASDGATPMDIVTVMNYNGQNPTFNSYWCPYQANNLRQITLGLNAPYMFTAKMDGCSFGVGTPAPGGAVTVGHANVGGDGQAQLGLLKGNAAFGVNGLGLSGYLGPGAYRQADGATNMQTQATTFGVLQAGVVWRFFSQVCIFKPGANGGPRTIQLVNVVDVA